MKRFLLLLLILYTFTSYAQDVAGCLKNIAGEPIPFASLVLHTNADSVIATALTDSLGEFTLACMFDREEVLALSIYCLGYRDTTLLFHSGVIRLYPTLYHDDYSLSEVIVRANKKPITYKNGEMIIDASFFTNSKGDKILDVLRRMPGILIKNDKILIDGKEPLVVINGTKQRVPITNIIKYFESVSAGNVSQVKINTTQLAENKTGTESVTLEIVTNTRKFDGVSLTSSAYFQKYKNDAYKYGNYIDFLFKNRNLSGNMSIGVSERKLYSEKQTSVDEEANLSLKNTYKKLSYFGVMNLSWSPTIIGGSINLYGSYYKDFDKKYAFEDYKNNLVNTKKSDRNNKNRPDLLSVNVEYNSKDTLNNRFKLSYGLLTGNSNLKENYSNTISQCYNLQNKFWGHQHIFEVQYTYQVGKCLFKVGLQDYLAAIHQRDIIENYNYSSNIKLSENIFAVYSSIGYALSKKLYLYMGWRSEYTDYRQKTYTSSCPENYWQNSPSFSFSYNVSDNYNTSLKLNTRSHRTSFYNILPGVGFQSDYEYSTGNPNLRPEKIYDVRWENLIFKYLNVRLSCKYIKDCWDIWYSLNGEDTRYTTYINFGDQIGYYIYTSIPFSFFSGKLRGTLNFNIYIKDIHADKLLWEMDSLEKSYASAYYKF